MVITKMPTEKRFRNPLILLNGEEPQPDRTCWTETALRFAESDLTPPHITAEIPQGYNIKHMLYDIHSQNPHRRIDTIDVPTVRESRFLGEQNAREYLDSRIITESAMPNIVSNYLIRRGIICRDITPIAGVCLQYIEQKGLRTSDKIGDAIETIISGYN